MPGCIHTYIHIHTTHTYRHTYTHIHTHIHTYMHAARHAHTHAYTHKNIKHTHTCSSRQLWPALGSSGKLWAVLGCGHFWAALGSCACMSALRAWGVLGCVGLASQSHFHGPGISRVGRALLLRGIRCSIVVSISACHAQDPGSIPGGGVLFPSMGNRHHGLGYRISVPACHLEACVA